jgi:hypothetical protein
VGGFVVTDRMLEMFKSKPGERARGQTSQAAAAGPATGESGETRASGGSGAAGTTDGGGAN